MQRLKSCIMVGELLEIGSLVLVSNELSVPENLPYSVHFLTPPPL